MIKNVLPYRTLPGVSDTALVITAIASAVVCLILVIVYFRLKASTQLWNIMAVLAALLFGVAAIAQLAVAIAPTAGENNKTAAPSAGSGSGSNSAASLPSREPADPLWCTTAGSPGAVEATPTAVGDLIFCPTKINGGNLPITGPFNLSGQVLGPQHGRDEMILLVRIDPSTCDANGQRGAPGRFLLDADLRSSADGTWFHEDDLGGQGSGVTLGRIFEFAKAPAATVRELRDSTPEWKESGIIQLPKKVTILASFEVPPGKSAGSVAC
ncbi:hypothetical protein I0C86_24655 [Plantactinospora sp. S1510]|uniref:DUF4352 domain-containing protein n=1 Tax=Plantactinospora alkalitolerans TaxID=2789879 RepID=A0ABS0H107_9ACTN|nr:hypothetical protein [Plantactinospora alkalitolerans]MBF9132120.1 hypothetical protein [Plantactinospora alkalitolerans]